MFFPITKILFITSASIILLLSPFFAFAQQGKIFEGVNEDCIEKGNCDLCDVLRVIININNFLIGLLGVLVLVMIIYSGFTFLISGGNPETVKKAKGILTGAIIGLIIALAAWLIVNFLMQFTDHTGTWSNPKCK